MKRTGRKAVMIAIYLISALMLLFLIWCIMSPGRIRTYDGKKSLSEKFVMDINGSPNGFLSTVRIPIILFCYLCPAVPVPMIVSLPTNIRI